MCFISYFSDYDALQRFETRVFYANSKYQKFMETEILNRKKLLNYVQIAKSYTKNIIRHSKDKSQILQQTQAEENLNAIENCKIKIRQLENENKEIENFLKESQKKIYQFRQ